MCYFYPWNNLQTRYCKKLWDMKWQGHLAYNSITGIRIHSVHFSDCSWNRLHSTRRKVTLINIAPYSHIQPRHSFSFSSLFGLNKVEGTTPLSKHSCSENNAFPWVGWTASLFPWSCPLHQTQQDRSRVTWLRRWQDIRILVQLTFKFKPQPYHLMYDIEQFRKPLNSRCPHL